MMPTTLSDLASSKLSTSSQCERSTTALSSMIAPWQSRFHRGIDVVLAKQSQRGVEALQKQPALFRRHADGGGHNGLQLIVGQRDRGALAPSALAFCSASCNSALGAGPSSQFIMCPSAMRV